MSVAAFATNLRYHYLVAFHLSLRRDGATDMCMRSAENPKASRQFHPLTLNVLENAKARGGLGMAKAIFTYCHLAADPSRAYMKETCWWTDHRSTLELFVAADGEFKKLCSKTRPCNYYGCHVHLRPEKGEYSDERRGSMYTDGWRPSLHVHPNVALRVSSGVCPFDDLSMSRLAELCYLLVNAACDHLSKVRMQDLDVAMSLDGNRDKCAVCGNNSGKKHTVNVYRCDGCPDVYHWRCIPTGFRKPNHGSSWFCPRRSCQAKDKRERQQ